MNCFCKSFITYFPFHIKSVVVVIFKRITEIKLTEWPGKRKQYCVFIQYLCTKKQINEQAIYEIRHPLSIYPALLALEPPAPP